MRTAQPAALDLLQRVILPVEHDPAVLPLYVDTEAWTTVVPPDAAGGRRRRSGEVSGWPLRISDAGGLGDIDGSRGFRVRERRSASFGTYFNAFPAAYWRRWSVLESVVLRVRTSGAGQVVVYRSNARGVIQKVESVVQRADGVVEFSLPLRFFGDGGWYWFDLVAEEAAFALVEAGWHAPAGTAPRERRTASLAITTMNRGEYCTKLLADIGGDPEVVDLLDAVYVVDQGSERLRDAPGFALAQERLGAKLRVIEQANIGGSGGFSRGMYETVRAGESDYVLILDDDVAIEPESIRRAIRFSDHLLQPAIVGGHMFDMYDRSRLHAFAEGIDTMNFNWGPISPTRHSFADSNLRQTRWMHRRIDAVYNGWWMSLIPVHVLQEIGLSMPVFIKWDDAEYSLRAAEHGVPTVTLPGAAVWHVSWVDKDDSQDWQAFYHARNRLVAALLHSPHEGGGRLPRANFATDLRHLLTMQYFAAAARIEAYRNVLEGPERLFDDLTTRLAATRRLAAGFSDGVPIKDLERRPELRRLRTTPVETEEAQPPSRIEGLILVARAAARHWLKPAETARETPPSAHLAYGDARWWVVPGYDSVLISNAEGSATLWHRRDRATFRQGLRLALRYRTTLRKEWGALADRYRSVMPQLVSVESWGELFDRLDRERP